MEKGWRVKRGCSILVRRGRGKEGTPLPLCGHDLGSFLKASASLRKLGVRIGGVRCLCGCVRFALCFGVAPWTGQTRIVISSLPECLPSSSDG